MSASCSALTIDLNSGPAVRESGMPRTCCAGREADGVVAPVVAQAALLEGEVLDELVDRHELERGDAEVGEVRDRRRVGDAGIRAADLPGRPG